MQSEGDALTLAATYPGIRDGFLSNARALQSDPGVVYQEVWSSKAALSRIYERRALAARAAVLRRAIEMTVGVLHERGLGIRPVVTVELNQRDQYAIGCDGEHRALAVSAAVLCRAVEIAVSGV